MGSIDMRMLPDWVKRADKISQLMKDAHYELSQAADLLLGMVRQGQWANSDGSHLATERALVLFEEIEAIKSGAPL